MRTNQEMLQFLKGTQDDQKFLFDEFLERLNNGEILDTGEIIIFETLKSQLFQSKQIVQMSANLTGNGGVTN